jgi:hypothetical protein
MVHRSTQSVRVLVLPPAQPELERDSGQITEIGRTRGPARHVAARHDGFPSEPEWRRQLGEDALG